MPFVKRWTNIKVGASVAAGAVGPQTVTGAIVSAMVPCRGAVAVVFLPKSTGSLAPSAAAIRVGMKSDGTGTVDPTSYGAGQDAVVARMDQGGTPVRINTAPNSVQFGFAQFTMTCNAGGHANFQLDVEVEYDGDADAKRADFGQSNVEPA